MLSRIFLSSLCRGLIHKASIFTLTPSIVRRRKRRWREGAGCRCSRYNLLVAVRPRADEPRRRLSHRRRPC